MAQAQTSFDDLVETAEGVIDFIENLHLEKDQERLSADLSVSEVNLAQKVLDMDDKRAQRLQELESLDEQLRKLKETSQNKDSKIEFLQRELEKN